MGKMESAAAMATTQTLPGFFHPMGRQEDGKTNWYKNQLVQGNKVLSVNWRAAGAEGLSLACSQKTNWYKTNWYKVTNFYQ